MVDHVHDDATQAVQLWLREDEPALGWHEPGATVSAYEEPFNTWASMPQLIDVEQWPGRATGRGRSPTSAARWRRRGRPTRRPSAYVAEHRARVRANAVELVERHARRTCCPASRRTGVPVGAALRSRRARRARRDRHPAATSPTSTRPTGTCSARPGPTPTGCGADESGYDNLVLAGDWTDNGLNAGCIEAATLSGLQAANAVLGRSRSHRIAGTWLS